MKQHELELINKLRRISKEEAAEFLTREFPAGSQLSGTALVAIRRISWPKAQQMLLAEHYLSNLPHSTSVWYDAFLTFMSVSNFLRAIRKIEINIDDLSLLEYYLRGSFSRLSVSDNEKEKIEQYFLSLKS